MTTWTSHTAYDYIITTIHDVGATEYWFQLTDSYFSDLTKLSYSYHEHMHI